MLLYLLVLLIFIASVLATAAIVVLVGDAVQMWRHPARGLPTCRRAARAFRAALSPRVSAGVR